MSPLPFDYFPSGGSAEFYSIQAQYEDKLAETECFVVHPSTQSSGSGSSHTHSHDWQSFEGGDSGSAIYPEIVHGNMTGEFLGVNGVYDDATDSYSNIDLSGTTKPFLPVPFQHTKPYCDSSCSYSSSAYQATMFPAEDKGSSSWFIQGSDCDSQMTYQNFEYDDHTNDMEESLEQYYEYYELPPEQTWSPTLTEDAVFTPCDVDASPTRCWPAGAMTTNTIHYSNYTKEMPLPHQGDDVFLEQWYDRLPNMDPGLHSPYVYQTGPSSYSLRHDRCAACNTPSDFTSSESPLSPLDPETCCSDSYSTLSPYSSLAPLPAAPSSASSSEPSQNSQILIHAPRPTRTIPVISFERLVAASKTLDHFGEEAT